MLERPWLLHHGRPYCQGIGPWNWAPVMPWQHSIHESLALVGGHITGQNLTNTNFKGSLPINSRERLMECLVPWHRTLHMEQLYKSTGHSIWSNFTKVRWLGRDSSPHALCWVRPAQEAKSNSGNFSCVFWVYLFSWTCLKLYCAPYYWFKTGTSTN
jgi:hypothetical protein